MLPAEIEKWMSEIIEGPALPESSNSCETHYRTWKDQHPELHRVQKVDPIALKEGLKTLKDRYFLEDSVLTLFQYVLSWISKPQNEKNNDILMQIQLFDNGSVFKPHFSGVPVSLKDWCFLHAVSRSVLHHRIEEHRQGVCNWYSHVKVSLYDLGSMQERES